jgi:hypothetical protein
VHQVERDVDAACERFQDEALRDIKAKRIQRSDAAMAHASSAIWRAARSARTADHVWSLEEIAALAG